MKYLIRLWRWLFPPRVVTIRVTKGSIKNEVMRREGLTGKQFQALIRRLRRDGVL